MAKNVFLPSGIAKELDSERGAGFNLTNYLKKVFVDFKVPFQDECCGTSSNGFTGTINANEGVFTFENGVLIEFIPD